LTRTAMRNLSSVRSHRKPLEIDMELSESELVSREERKKEFIQNRRYLIERRQREWLIKRGKKDLLDF
jgi:hypothetical protein